MEQHTTSSNVGLIESTQTAQTQSTASSSSGARVTPSGDIVRPTLERVGVEPSRSSRIVTGFGAEYCDDVFADQARREAEQLATARRRTSEGERGRMTDRTGEDLDRSAGGPWKAGRK